MTKHTTVKRVKAWAVVWKGSGKIRLSNLYWTIDMAKRNAETDYDGKRVIPVTIVYPSLKSPKKKR